MKKRDVIARIGTREIERQLMFKIDSRGLILAISIFSLCGCSAAPDSSEFAEPPRFEDDGAAGLGGAGTETAIEESPTNQAAPLSECRTELVTHYSGLAQCYISIRSFPYRVQISKNFADSLSPTVYLNGPPGSSCAAQLPNSFSVCKPSPIVGNIDGIATFPDGRIEVGGWACEQGAQGVTSSVHVYVGGPAGSGTMLTSGIANLSSEPAVAAQCGDGRVGHRFKIDLTPWKQSYQGAAVYVHGISQSGGSNLLVGNAGKYSIPVAPLACSLSSPQNGTLVPKGRSVTLSLRSSGMPSRLVVLWIGTDNGVAIAPQLAPAANGDFSYVNTNTTQITYVRRAEFRNDNSGAIVCTTNPVTTTFLP